MRKSHLALLTGLCLFTSFNAFSQTCTPQGDQVSYGSNDTWIGYVYDNPNLTNYKGYVTEGSPGNPNFLQEFAGMYVNYPTNGCSVYTETFSIRYRLRKTFAAGNYDFSVAGDDGYRLSIDGGATWVIDNWFYAGFNLNTVTAYLNGTYDLVLEFYDYAHSNKISFQVNSACVASENTSIYGTGNVWRGYVFNDEHFGNYRGMITEGNVSSSAFDQNFGGAYTRFNTSACDLLAEHFSVRYRLSKTFSANSYSIIVGSEDGYRLSLDGGATWIVDNWTNGSYKATSITANLNGSYNMVLEYHENTGANRINFSSGAAIVLPIQLSSFTVRNTGSSIILQWETGSPGDVDHFEIERSRNGQVYEAIGIRQGDNNLNKYGYTDQYTVRGEMFYRLKMVDKTGKTYYSNGIIVSGIRQETKIFPSLVRNNIIYISNENSLGTAVLTVADMSGRVIGRYQLKNVAPRQTTSVFLPGNLLKGMYVVKLESAGMILVTEKIYIQ